MRFQNKVKSYLGLLCCPSRAGAVRISAGHAVAALSRQQHHLHSNVLRQLAHWLARDLHHSDLHGVGYDGRSHERSASHVDKGRREEQ